MAEQAIPNTGDPRVDAALSRIRGKFTDLEDVMIVQAHLEKGLAEQAKLQARRLADLISGLEAESAERRAKDAALDARVDKLVSSIGELISRIPPAALGQFQFLAMRATIAASPGEVRSRRTFRQKFLAPTWPYGMCFFGGMFVVLVYVISERFPALAAPAAAKTIFGLFVAL
jgi:hypothetical protein